MDKTVVINSVHTDSVSCIKRVCPQTIITFDAHPDFFHWKNLDTIAAVSQLPIPEKVKTSLFRASIMALLRASFPQSQLISVVPEACIITNFNWELQQKSWLGINTRRKRYRKGDAISWWNERLRTLSIEGVTVPPKPVESLISIAEGKPLVFDIDADYLFELTRECHTPAAFTDVPIPVDGMPQENMGSTRDILQLISLEKPELVTLSELTYCCIEARNEHLMHFLDSLEKIGYKIEKGTFYNDDAFREILEIKSSFDNYCYHRPYSEAADDFLRAYLDFFESKGIK